MRRIPGCCSRERGRTSIKVPHQKTTPKSSSELQPKSFIPTLCYDQHQILSCRKYEGSNLKDLKVLLSVLQARVMIKIQGRTGFHGKHMKTCAWFILYWYVTPVEWSNHLEWVLKQIQMIREHPRTVLLTVMNRSCGVCYLQVWTNKRLAV